MTLTRTLTPTLPGGAGGMQPPKPVPPTGLGAAPGGAPPTPGGMTPERQRLTEAIMKASAGGPSSVAMPIPSASPLGPMQQIAVANPIAAAPRPSPQVPGAATKAGPSAMKQKPARGVQRGGSFFKPYRPQRPGG